MAIRRPGPVGRFLLVVGAFCPFVVLFSAMAILVVDGNPFAPLLVGVLAMIVTSLPVCLYCYHHLHASGRFTRREIWRWTWLFNAFFTVAFLIYLQKHVFTVEDDEPECTPRGDVVALNRCMPVPSSARVLDSALIVVCLALAVLLSVRSVRFITVPGAGDAAAPGPSPMALILPVPLAIVAILAFCAMFVRSARMALVLALVLLPAAVWGAVDVLTSSAGGGYEVPSAVAGVVFAALTGVVAAQQTLM
jgi:hypothetical protein